MSPRDQWPHTQTHTWDISSDYSMAAHTVLRHTETSRCCRLGMNVINVTHVGLLRDGILVFKRVVGELGGVVGELGGMMGRCVTVVGSTVKRHGTVTCREGQTDRSK